MIIKNTKSFMDFCNQIGIHDLISKNPTIKFKKTDKEIDKLWLNKAIGRISDKNLGGGEQRIEEIIIEPEKKEKLVNHVKTDSSVFDGEQFSKVERFL